jgi:hypothetical protein
MAASFTSSALNLERFAEAMKYVAPVAKASGITLEQTAAMMSKLADAGIHGSMAGTALRQIMLEMAKAGKTGMQGFNEMAKAGLSLADANDEVGQRAATALLILSENEKAVNNLTESYNNAEGAAKKMADTQMDNLSGAITILSSAWEGLVLKLTEGDGVLRKIVDGLASFLQFLTRNGRIIVNVAKAIATLTTAFLAYRTALFLTNTQVGLYIASLTSKNAVLSLSTIRTYALAKAQAALNAIMKLNPFALVASALAAVTMAMAMQTEEVKLLYDELGRTNEEYEKMYENLTEIEKVQKKIKDIAGEGLEIGQLDVAKETLRIYKEAWDNGLSRIESERGAILITEELIKGQEKRVAELESQLNELKTKQTEIKNEEIKKENEHTKKLAEEHIKRIEQQRDFRTSELKLWGAGQSAIFASEQRFNEEILELRKKYGLLNEIEYKTQANNLAIARKRQHQKELEETQAMFNEMMLSLPENESANEDFSFFESPVSFKERFEEYKDVYREAGQSVVDITREHYEEMREIADMEKQLADDKVNNARDYFNQQQNLAAQGFQNNMAQAEKELLLAKQTQAKAEREQRKALRNQQMLQSIEQGVNLVTASTSLIKTSNANPLIYIPLLATMWGTFFAQKAKSIKATRYGKGGMFDVGGGSHESGNDTSLGVHGGIERIVEGGEKVFVVNKTSSKKYRNMLPNLVDSINKGNLSVKADSRGNIVNISTERMERGLDKIAKNTSTITYTKNGKTIIKQGLNTIEYV